MEKLNGGLLMVTGFRVGEHQIGQRNDDAVPSGYAVLGQGSHHGERLLQHLLLVPGGLRPLPALLLFSGAQRPPLQGPSASAAETR